tara:strand:- start:1356 stop:1769 length:414 start_codon:yes stop_codon:yes gene_type:complete
MKLLRKTIRRIIKETISDSRFQFSFNPAEYITKDLDVDQIHTMIEMLLDADEINYAVERNRQGWSYEFGFVDKDRTKPDPKSYQAFLALRTALTQEIGIPTLKDLYGNDLFGDVYVSFRGSTPVIGIIEIKQSQRYE